MIQAVDHVVILVENLERAARDYSRLGFNVVPGGEHSDGATRNALIGLADGSYIELVAFSGKVLPEHPFYRPDGGEGLIAFALLPDSVGTAIVEAQQRGLAIQGPTRGGRARPDKVQIEWEIGRAYTHDLPFLCADITARDLRAPGGDLALHPNGATGIAGITVLVRNLVESISHYRALLGADPLPYYTRMVSAAFQVGKTTLTLAEPSDEATRDYLSRLGDGPYALALRASTPGTRTLLDPDLTHGVRIELVHENESYDLPSGADELTAE